jgi:hypothetical protein
VPADIYVPDAEIAVADGADESLDGEDDEDSPAAAAAAAAEDKAGAAAASAAAAAAPTSAIAKDLARKVRSGADRSARCPARTPIRLTHRVSFVRCLWCRSAI